MADTPIEEVDNKPLGQCDLVEIKQYLKDLGRPTVTDLGLVLGILYSTMRDLPDNEFLNQVITLWLGKADNVTTREEPSWRTLVKGLRHDQVRQTGVANNITKEHCITDGQSQRTADSNRAEREARPQKDTEIERLQRELKELKVCMEAKETQLQQEDDQIQQLGTKLMEKDTEIERQQKELQRLRNQNAAKEQILTAVQSQVQQLQMEFGATIGQIQQQLELRDQTTSRDESVAAMEPPSKKVKVMPPLPQKSQLHPLSELSLKWRRLENMPGAMVYPQAVTVDKAVYVADREALSGDIHRFDPQTQQWIKLPEYQCYHFTMTEVNNQLTVVGGCDMSKPETSNKVSVYSNLERKWKEHSPSLNKPREYPAVSTYKQHLVVAGGYGTSSNELATVEILPMSTSDCRWFSVTPLVLPVSCSVMSAAIIHGTLYLLGGSLEKRVISMPLPSLTQTCEPPESCTICDAPLEGSTAIAVRGHLLAVGGGRSSAVHMYDQERNAWNKVGNLPTEREHCTCCLLPSGEILVAGGRDRNGNWTSRMDAAAV